MDIVITLAMIAGGSVVFQLVGMVWYGPLFGKKWMRSSGKKKEDLKMTKEESKKVYGGSFAIGMVSSTFLYLMAVDSNIPIMGLAIGIIAAVIFAAAVTLPSYLFEKRPVMMWALHYGYVIVAALIAGMLMHLLS